MIPNWMYVAWRRCAKPRPTFFFTLKEQCRTKQESQKNNSKLRCRPKIVIRTEDWHSHDGELCNSINILSFFLKPLAFPSFLFVGKKARCRKGIRSWCLPPRVWKSVSSSAILTPKIVVRILFLKHLVVKIMLTKWNEKVWCRITFISYQKGIA